MRIVGIVLILLFVIGGIFIGLSLRQPVVAEPFSRTVEPKVLWGGGEVDVTLALSSATLPPCTPSRRSADIVLLIDRSGSMAGAPFQQAVAAANAFVQKVDLTGNQVAILFFNEEPTLVQPLTADLTSLEQALLTVSTDGKTEIGAALLATQSQLLAGARADAKSVVVLLSDGGTSNDRQARDVAQALKEAGVRIITIALPGDDQDSAFMRAVASRPSDAYDSISLAQLEVIYRSLAEEINEAIAFDVRVEEVLNTDSFSVMDNSINPTGQFDSASIGWKMGTLPEEGAEFRYRLTTNGVGLRTISETPGQMSLKDCAGGAPVWTLPAGPDVLVMPSPLWLIPLLVTSLLLLFALLSWFRRQGEEVRKPRPPRPRTEPQPSLDETPAWLKRLDESLFLVADAQDVEASRLQNTVLIGCGPAGREVLSQMAQILRSRFGQQMPDNVRLMQIDIELGHEGGFQRRATSVPSFPDELKPLIQHVVLRPNLEEVKRNLRERPDEWTHWQWYQASEPTYERARGRMALFYDLRNGSANSELWNVLDKMLSGLHGAKIRVIGSTFDDTSSGMLVDVARLTRAVTAQSFDVEFWLAAPVGQAWSARLHNPRQLLPPEEQQARTLATLRELARLQRNTRVPFIYVPPTSRQSELREKAGGVVQSLFLFQPQQQSQASPEDDVLACMAETLLALLHPEVNQALIEHLNTNKFTAGKKINQEGEGMACAIGCYAFRVPRTPLAEALNWRLVRDVLYDATVGLVPLNRCRSDGSHTAISKQQREGLIDKQALRQDAETFVNGFADASRHSPAVNPSPAVKPPIDSPAFVAQLRQKVDTYLNGSGDEDVMQRSHGLRQAQVWLEVVRFLVLRQQKRLVAKQIDALRKELEAWERWLSGDVYRVSEDHWQQAREELERLRQQPARNWLVDDSLEWPLYQKEVRSWLEVPQARTGEPLIRAGKRFGWQVRTAPEGPEDNKWRVHLLVPPPDFVWSDRGVATEKMAIERTQEPHELLQKLYHLAQSFTRLDYDDTLLAQAQEQDSMDWLRLAEPRLKYDKSTASKQMGQVNEAALLVGPTASQIETIKAKLSDARRALNLSSHKTADKSTIVLLRMEDWIPLTTTSNYDDETRRNYPISPPLHVWRAEQVAAEIEQGGEMLGSTFMSWLATDEEVVTLFARSYLYDAIKHKRGAWHIPGLDVLSGYSPIDVLRTLIEKPPVALKNNRKRLLSTWQQALIERENEAASNKRAYRRRAKEEKIAPLLNSKQAPERDLGRYLQYLMTPRY